MTKKIPYVLLFLFSILTLASCNKPIDETKEIVLPNLEGMTQEMALTIFNELDVVVTVEEVINNEIKKGRFIAYNDPFTSGDIVEPKTLITLYFVKQANILPDLSDMNETQIKAELANLEVSVIFEEYETNDIQVGIFVEYDQELKAGDIVELETSLVVYLAVELENLLTLPNLSGLSRSEIITELLKLNFDFDILTVMKNNMPEELFVSYGNDLVAGSLVSPGQEIVVYVSEHVNMLPDLTGLNKVQILSALSDLRLVVEFQIVETNDIAQGLFVYYGQGKEQGDIISDNAVIVIYLAEPIIIVETGIIISKYLEGTLNDRAIELYNMADHAIDLTNFRLDIYVNGEEDASIIMQLTGQIMPQQAFVIAYENSSEAILEKANYTSPDLNFNGNDVIALTYKNDVIVDVVGRIGMGISFASNQILVRDISIVEPSDTFTIRNWNVYYQNYIEILGQHPVVYPTSFTFDSNDLAIDFIEHRGMVLVEFVANNDGDTAEFTPGFTGGSRVRFIGVNTPETGTGQVAIDATEFVYNRLNNATTIYLQHDPTAGLNDTYGRTLALIWVDGVLLNYEIVRRGYSQNNYTDIDNHFIFHGVTLKTWMDNAQIHAQTYRLGVWA